MAHVLVVEDDPGIRSALQRSLSEQGHAVSSAACGVDGLSSAVNEDPDLVLLDLGLPDIDGLQVLAMIRAVTPVPIIVVTARDDEPTVIRALDAGADDYVIKPFAAAALDARIRAVLRRLAGPDTPVPLQVGELVIDNSSRIATLAGVELELSRLEFDLLSLLAQKAGQVVTKKDIATEVWQQAYGNERTVDVHLSWLRRKLGETAAQPRYLQSVRGVGVRLVDPTKAAG